MVVPVAGMPIRNQAGDLVHDVGSCLDVWQSHFATLIGHPDAAHHQQVAAAGDADDAAAGAAAVAEAEAEAADEDDVEAVVANVPQRGELRAPDGSSLDVRFTAEEMLLAPRALKRNAAVGPDDVPVEVLLLADSGQPVSDQAADLDGPHPSNAFAAALLAGLNAMLTGEESVDSAVVADRVANAAWHTVRLRPVPKRGADLTRTDAYRGIGIQSALARLLAMMALRRLSPAVEAAGLLDASQAGFRPLEEAVAQTAALLEVVGRRRQSGRATYLLFLDFAKAYDSVPHAKLLRKLECLGIGGRMLR
jgi:hypothetical protein